MDFASPTYAELISQRNKFCEMLRNAPPHQIGTQWQRDLVIEIAYLNKQLAHTEIVSRDQYRDFT